MVGKGMREWVNKKGMGRLLEKIWENISGIGINVLSLQWINA